MPLIVPRSAPKADAATPLLPAAVLLVCEPWPLKSRGELYSIGCCSPAAL